VYAGDEALEPVLGRRSDLAILRIDKQDLIVSL
jgi:hypothetical protein